MQEKIGIAAGQVWQYLSKSSAPVNISDLPKKVNMSTPMAYQALGWLAREGKISYQQKDRQTMICLISSECGSE